MRAQADKVCCDADEWYSPIESGWIEQEEEDSSEVQWKKSKKRYDRVLTALNEPCAIETMFLELAEDWKDATGGKSITSHMISHPSYLKIIGMGPKVVPFILKDLERESANWYPALRVLTDADPIEEKDRGSNKRLRAAWLKFARDKGLI